MNDINILYLMKIRKQRKQRNLDQSNKININQIKQYLQKLLNRSLQLQLFSEQQVNLCYQALQQCIDFSSFIWVRTLKLQGNLIKNINRLFLPKNITYLSLGSNALQSIQKLHTLELKDLKTLKLYSNKFISIKSLRKGDWPNLQLIDLSDNDGVHDFQYIAQLHRNYSNQVVTKVILSSAVDKLFKNKIEKVEGKCYKKRLNIQIFEEW